MPVHYTTLSNGVKISPFKLQNYGDGDLINTTKYGAGINERAITQEVTYPDGSSEKIIWPSAEQAFHAQKVIDYIRDHPEKQKILREMLLEIRNHPGKDREFLPRDCYDEIAIKYAKKLGLEPKKDKINKVVHYDWSLAIEFEASNQSLEHEKLNYKRMKRVLRLKFNQHLDLAAKAKLYAANGIMPIEVSESDGTWASGLDGKGKNLLGILILEIGNELLRKEGRESEIKIPEPLLYYDEKFKDSSDLVSHDKLVVYCEGKKDLYSTELQTAPGSPANSSDKRSVSMKDRAQAQKETVEDLKNAIHAPQTTQSQPIIDISVPATNSPIKVTSSDTATDISLRLKKIKDVKQKSGWRNEKFTQLKDRAKRENIDISDPNIMNLLIVSACADKLNKLVKTDPDKSYAYSRSTLANPDDYASNRQIKSNIYTQGDWSCTIDGGPKKDILSVMQNGQEIFQVLPDKNKIQFSIPNPSPEQRLVALEMFQEMSGVQGKSSKVRIHCENTSMKKEFEKDAGKAGMNTATSIATNHRNKLS